MKFNTMASEYELTIKNKKFMIQKIAGESNEVKVGDYFDVDSVGFTRELGLMTLPFHTSPIQEPDKVKEWLNQNAFERDGFWFIRGANNGKKN
jgi:hypothetical protein